MPPLPEFGRRIVELLDIVPEDFRDGLFLACWFDGKAAVQRKLLAKFGEWTADPKWGGGSGEEGWLYIFLTKWTTESTFPFRRLEPLIRWKLERDFRRSERPHPATSSPSKPPTASPPSPSASCAASARGRRKARSAVSFSAFGA